MQAFLGDFNSQTSQAITDGNQNILQTLTSQQTAAFTKFGAVVDHKIESRVRPLEERIDEQETRFTSVERSLADDRASITSLTTQLEEVRKELGILQTPYGCSCLRPWLQTR